MVSHEPRSYDEDDGGEAPAVKRASRLTISEVLICVVALVGVTGVFLHHPATTAAGGVSLIAFLILNRKRLGPAALVPLALSAVALGSAIWQGVSTQALLTATDRALFLSALLCMFAFLRETAGRSKDVVKAGAFLTGQPPGRRYVALCFGGHLFGTLVNLGGLALLLDMAVRANRANNGGFPADIQELRLKRMTLAIVRGFTLVTFWSPLGFAVNSLLLAMPGLDYTFLGSLGLALTVPVSALGWLFDRMLVPKGFRSSAPAPEPAMGAVLRLVGHVALLGGLVIGLYTFGVLAFQQSLLVAVPIYTLVWLAALRTGTGTRMSVATGIAATVHALPRAASEIGAFAAAGLLSVLLLLILPVEKVQRLLTGLALPPATIAALLGIMVFVLGLVGVNPIIGASVLGSLVSHLNIEGLSAAGAAFAMLSAWSGLLGSSPFITTVVYAGAIIGRSPVTVGLRWNGAYALTLLVLSQLLVAAAIQVGWL